MNEMRKAYVRKLLIIVACIVFVAFMVYCLAVGGWLRYIPIVIVGGACAIYLLGVFVILIAMQVWKWRLMGECNEKWEVDLFKWWWRWMGYGSGDWEDLIPELIAHDYGDEPQAYESAMELFERLKAVKAPWVLTVI